MLKLLTATVIGAASANTDESTPGSRGEFVKDTKGDLSDVFFNEIHYDNAKKLNSDGELTSALRDVGEGYEIAGKAGTDLEDYYVVHYNGRNGMKYGSNKVLDGKLVDKKCGWGFKWFNAPGLQNGAPDGIALVRQHGTRDRSNTPIKDDEVIQFLSYEGTFTAKDGPAEGMLSTEINVNQQNPKGIKEHTMQLVGSYPNFKWEENIAKTHDLVNTGQEFCTATPTPTERCDANNCMSWSCADWCECYDESMLDVYESHPECQDDNDDTCICFQEEDDMHPKQVHEGTTRHDKMHYRQYQKHKVVCGRHNPRECNEADRWETDKAAKHEVRCCSDVAPTNFLKNLRNMKNCANPHNPGPSVSRVGHRLPGIQGVWGMSKVGNTGDKCVHSATFDEAEAICADIPNGRLCTEEELKAECTSGTGCMHDFDLVWVKPQMVGVDTRPVQEEAAPVDPVQFMGCYNQDQIPGWSQWSCAPDADTFYVNCNRLGGSHDAMVEQCANTCRSRGATQFDIHDRTACFCGTANNEAIVSPPITDLYDPGCKNYLYRLN